MLLWSGMSDRKRLADGVRRKEIAAQLYMSERTVSKHIQHIFEKLDVFRGGGDCKGHPSGLYSASLACFNGDWQSTAPRCFTADRVHKRWLQAGFDGGGPGPFGKDELSTTA